MHADPSPFSFPRSAWECIQRHSASLVGTGFALVGREAGIQDAKRPGLHFHAERGNEGLCP